MRTMQENNITPLGLVDPDDPNSAIICAVGLPGEEVKEPTSSDEVATPGSFYVDQDNQECHYILPCLPSIRVTTKIPTTRQLLQAKGWLENTLQNDPDSAINDFLVIKLVTLCSTFYDLEKQDYIKVTFDTIIAAMPIGGIKNNLKLFFRWLKEFGISALLESAMS